MSILSLRPFSGNEIIEVSEAEIDVRLPIKARAIRPKNIMSIVFGSNYKYKDRANFEESPYDFERIMKAIDTDSYVKQAFGKYKDLFWKEGWVITGENQEAVNYIWDRIALMEQMMGQPFDEFLGEVVDQLIKFSNVFIAKARADISPAVSRLKRLPDEERAKIVAGFYIIPTETVRIKRNKFNKPIAYAQQLNDQTYNSGTGETKDYIRWPAEDVIHLYLDRKPGRAFGTPFIEPALDDIVSLRQVEEDVLNLVHRELHPLYIYKVGNDKYPTKEGEIDEAIVSIEALKAEGGLVAPHNHSVEVIGAEGNALDAEKYLMHFKERVSIGLGVSPHHLGMMEGTSNRSVTERLDLALYDKIKNLQSYIENRLRLDIINPMLVEGGFDPTGPINNKSSDECFFDFNEIDIDTQIKKENHIIDKFAKSAITFSEMRDQLKMDQGVDAEELMMVLQAKIQAYIQGQAPTAGGSASAPSASRPDAAKPASKGQVNLPNLQKGPSTKNRPVNQYKRLPSPNVRNQLELTGDFVENIIDLIIEDENEDF